MNIKILYRRFHIFFLSCCRIFMAPTRSNVETEKKTKRACIFLSLFRSFALSLLQQLLLEDEVTTWQESATVFIVTRVMLP
jgi:hypothetical protein